MPASKRYVVTKTVEVEVDASNSNQALERATQRFNADPKANDSTDRYAGKVSTIETNIKIKRY